MAVETVLRTLRVDRQLRLEDIAKAVGVSVAGYQQIETGRRGVSADVAKKIAGYFEMPVDGIFVPTYFTVRKGAVL